MQHKFFSSSVCIGIHLWLILFLPSVTHAHVARMTSATATVSPDGHVQLTLTLDALSYALNTTSQRTPDESMNALLDGPEQNLRNALASAHDRLLHSTHFAPGGAIDSLTFPTTDDIQAYLKTNPHPRLPVVMTATLSGHLPPDSPTFSLQLPEVLGTVILTVERPGDEPAAVAVDPGRWSEPIPLHLPPHTHSPAVPFHKTLAEFLSLGFKHILPEGLDHILFVLGLFLLSNKLKPLLLQVTSFTLAHSLTLGLSLYGVVRLPSAIVEPLITLSIAFVAVENIVTSRLHPWRPFVVFAFGLIHGLGFAGILHDLSLSRTQFLPALIGFNTGVELGQLSVLAAAFLVVGWFRSANWYRPAVTIPASLLIAATGLFWTVQRILSP